MQSLGLRLCICKIKLIRPTTLYRYNGSALITKGFELDVVAVVLKKIF